MLSVRLFIQTIFLKTDYTNIELAYLFGVLYEKKFIGRSVL